MTTTPLKRIMFEHQMKAKSLAERVGVTESTLSQIVNGKRVPTLGVALRIAKALGVSVEQLWGYLDEEEVEIE